MRATSALVELRQRLGLTEPVAVEVVQMWDRPFRVACGRQSRSSLYEQVEDPEVLRIAETWPRGA